MNFRVRLAHADGQQRVVVVQAFEGERCLGSALGEASSAEEAEDRALDRLLRRLQASSSRSPTALASSPPSQPSSPYSPSLPSSSPHTPPATSPPSQLSQPSSPSPPHIPPATPPPTSHPSPIPTSAGGDPDPLGAPSDPEDWSADLIQLDRLLRNLGWGREEERIYLQRLFGQPNRSRLTRYSDLMVLRRALEALPPDSQPESAPLPLLRSDLLSQCDGLLVHLGWTTDRARQALEQHFAVSSRQRLSDEQLLAFNLLLEGELLPHSQTS